NAPRMSRRPRPLQRGLDDRGGRDLADIQPQRARGDAAHVEEVLDELRLDTRVALDDLEPALEVDGAHARHAQDLRPPENRVERRPQLVRQGGQELVLHGARPLGVRPRQPIAALVADVAHATHPARRAAVDARNARMALEYTE